EVLLCDEVSLGLAPIVIRELYAALPAIRADGTAIVVVEQDINQALQVADRVYCFMEGRVTLSGKPAALSREQIRAAYFGMEGGAMTSNCHSERSEESFRHDAHCATSKRSLYRLKGCGLLR